jgi:hypothetical protein
VIFSSRIASSIEACCTEDKEAGLRHLLLFVSALIPKAFASILTSLVLELSKPENVRNTLRYALLSPITKLMSIRPDGESVQMTIHCWTTLF